MKTPLKQEQILTFGKTKVASLSEEIRNEIITLEKYLQEKIDLSYELEKLEIAIQVKYTQISNHINDLEDAKEMAGKLSPSAEDKP